MFSHLLALENNICERKGPKNGCNRAKLTNLHSSLNCVIFGEFIQLPTPMRHALLMINKSIWKILTARSVTATMDFFKDYIILNNHTILLTFKLHAFHYHTVLYMLFECLFPSRPWTHWHKNLLAFDWKRNAILAKVILKNLTG